MEMVGKAGFEPTTSWSRTKRSTKLSHFPKKVQQWSGREDSNFRPLAPHASALANCATPRFFRGANIRKFYETYNF